jgi:hypothetical protein
MHPTILRSRTSLRLCAALAAAVTLAAGGVTVAQHLSPGHRTRPAAVRLADDSDPAVDTAVRETVGVTGSGLAQLVTTLKSLTPRQLDSYLAALSDQDLNRLNGLLPAPNVRADERWELTDVLLANASADSIRRITPLLTFLQPPLQTGDNAEQKSTRWDWQYGMSPADTPSGGALYGPSGQPQLDDADQRDLNDCYFHAELLSLARIDPAWIQSDITAEPNGTFSVTFYRGGHPTKVRITDNLPYNGTDWTYGGVADGIWIALYEKAYAQLLGGYGAIEGENPLSPQSWTGAAYTDLTGMPSDRTGWVLFDPPTLETLSSWLTQGRAVVTATQPKGTHFVDAPVVPVDDAGTPTGSAESYVLETGHEYVVESVDMRARTVTLANPWGSDSTATTPPSDTVKPIPFQVTISESTYRSVFGDAAAVTPPGPRDSHYR